MEEVSGGGVVIGALCPDAHACCHWQGGLLRLQQAGLQFLEQLPA